MFAKGKGSAVPSDGQAREKLALYVYEYLLHVGAQKSAQTFLSEIRWEKNITLGEPPGFLHSWWCVFWDLYCAAPERRDTCEHSSEAKAFHDYASPWLLACQCSSDNVTSTTDLQPPLFGLAPLKRLELAEGEVWRVEDALESGAGGDPLCSVSAAAAPSPVLGNIPPNDGMPGGPIPPGFFQGPPGSQPSPHAQPPPHNPSSMMGPHSQPFMSPRYAGGPRPPIRMGNQPPGGVPGTQPLLPNSMDPTRQQGHPNMGGSMQRMNPPRGMGPMGPGPQNYGSGMRPPPNSLGPAMPGINMGPGAGRPWPNPNSANSIPYSSSSPGTYVGPPGGGGPPGTPIMPSPADSTNSSDNIYTMINPVPPGGSRSNFPMGPGSDGPMGGMGGMEPHHMNGSLGSGDIDGLPKNSPNNISGISNPPGTPRDDGELGGNFLHSFQNDNYSPSMTMSV
ncbi:single-stranded DNA-binding protein 3 isoform X2 [Trachypithecus francoisi]|uniref:single-stranded DNA-binding protein 3 isoform X2 n=1 Tax=Trachypithecus francoisi TaxID=54180 RepID=UPI00141A871D|nr:single-stranded DNA-binding protein 3 isoform X2 [Trachypithecus francoisi]